MVDFMLSLVNAMQVQRDKRSSYFNLKISFSSGNYYIVFPCSDEIFLSTKSPRQNSNNSSHHSDRHLCIVLLILVRKNSNTKCTIF